MVVLLIISFVITFAIFSGKQTCTTQFNNDELNQTSTYTIPLRTDGYVFMDKEKMNALKFLWEHSEEEYILCLNGEVGKSKYGTSIYIKNFTRVNVYTQNTTSVTFDPTTCLGAIGTIHNHPRSNETNYCLPSLTDIYAWGGIEGSNEIQAIQCGPEDIAFYKVPRDESFTLATYPLTLL
jgi:hypothetical protein